MASSKDIFDIINKSENILIVINKEISTSEVSSLKSFLSVLNSYRKEYSVLILRQLSEIVLNKIKEEEINYVSEISGSDFVLTIDYGSTGVSKVTYDIDSDKGLLMFKISPTDNKFSFENISFSEGSGKFDGTIMIGVENPEQLDMYSDETAYLFESNPTINFFDVNEITNSLIENEGQLDQKVVDALTNDFVSRNNIIEGNLVGDRRDALAKLLSKNGNLSRSIRKKYYSKDEKYIEILKVALRNYKTVGKIAYSVLKKETVGEMPFDDIATFGRIPFNVLKNVDLAFLFFQLNDLVAVVIESNSNKYNAATIAGVFNGSGDSGHAYAKLDGIAADELDKQFWPIMKDLYNIDISSKS